MTIRPATPDDVGVLASLEAACFDVPWTEHAISEALADAKYIMLLGEEESHAVAYVIGWSVGDEAELARVGVLTSWRGRGWGEAVTRALMQQLHERRVKAVFLEVRVSNQTAQRLYQRCGFKRVGLRPKYYADGEDAVVMRAQSEPERSE